MNVVIAQINLTVGDVRGNFLRIVDAARKAEAQGAELVVFPELTLTGYAPEDLVICPEFVAAQHRTMLELVNASKGLPAMIVGFIEPLEERRFNALALIDKGRIVHTHRKNLLPNYGVFDERRVFSSGHAPVAFSWKGRRLGLLLCEDAWQPHNVRLLTLQGADCIFVANASPYETGKHAQRSNVIAAAARAYGVDIVYVNLVGGQDDLVFDGASFAVNAQGVITTQLPAFQDTVAPLGTLATLPVCEEEMLWHGAVLATRDYVRKSGFSKVLLGLSGGIDSALVAALVVDALGAEHVLGVLLPSPFTSRESTQCAHALAQQHNIQTLEVPIHGVLDSIGSTLLPALNTLGYTQADWQADICVGGNVQSRLRGMHLMAISNATGRLLMNTSNKSEIAVGYSTLYGDACGAYAPIRDLYKTQVYALARWRGLPAQIIDRAPTAELAPGQKDEDQLPPYATLDAILKLHIEGRMDAETIVGQGFAREVVKSVVDMVRTSEYKRRQFPPGPKLSPMHFYKDWRMPLTNTFKG